MDLGKDGPLVFDAPPMLQGILMDFWQRPIPMDGGRFAGDVGFFGPDQGKGGKFLLLPPGYDRDNPVPNADGSTDLFLGPKAPEGKEKNWLATVRGKGYFAILRLYGPTEPALGKTWKPGDFTRV